jgi:hypothetical protein
VGVSGSGYKVLGYAVWQGGKWYLRRRLPSARVSVAAGATVLSAVIAAALLARRIAG